MIDNDIRVYGAQTSIALRRAKRVADAQHRPLLRCLNFGAAVVAAVVLLCLDDLECLACVFAGCWLAVAEVVAPLVDVAASSGGTLPNVIANKLRVIA